MAVSIWPPGPTARKLFVIALIGLFYVWLVHGSPFMMFFWSIVPYYVYPYVDYVWVLDLIALVIISLTAFWVYRK